MSGHHYHVQRSGRNLTRLTVSLVLVLAYTAAELVGGLITNSLALLADAGHMLSDAASLGLALFAAWVARRPPSPERSFGFRRTEVLSALANGAALLAVAVFIVIEAVERLHAPPAVRGGPMLAVASGGLLVNLVTMWVLHGGRAENLNVRGAWLHVLADTVGSLQAIVAGSLILWLGWFWADPAASILIATLVVWSSWSLLRECVNVLMEGTPQHIDATEVRQAIASLPGIAQVHDLHVWTISTGFESLSVHVVAGEGDRDRILERVRSLVHHRFGITHSTIQVEAAGTCRSDTCD